MAIATLPSRLWNFRPGPASQLVMGLALLLAATLFLIGPDRLFAQIEGERGILPVASSTDIQVSGIEVETTGKDAEEARLEGWKIAQRKAWEKLKGPSMGDGQIAGMVSAVVIEREMIGPKRYIATLGVIFDRQRAGQYVGSAAGGGMARSHSAPLLVIPVLYSGGAAQVFEVRGAWQKAWAEFRTSASPIDYVRPAGSGGESLILTAGQAGRRSRTWWRTVLDQFGASDVIMPVARLERQWPGGPIEGTFTARYGPDSAYLESFKLTAESEKGVPAMLNQALVRIDQIYARALAMGLLKPDPSLVAEQQAIDAALAKIAAAAAAVETRPLSTESPKPRASESSDAAQPTAAPEPVKTTASYTVQFSSPDAQAVDSALGAVRGVSGVKGAATTSIAIGGTSVMRVTFTGDINDLAAALRSRGWQVSAGGNALSIRR